MTESVTSEVAIHGGIIVGHDGSRHADRALHWAAGWSLHTGLGLHVIRTWTLSTAPRPDSWSPGYVPPMTDFESAVLESLRRDVEAADLPDGLVSLTCHVLHGSPGRRLIEASGRAELLVVSSRGRGGFAGLVMGSTTDQLVRHAHCPVVVIPAHALDDEPSDSDHIATG